MRLREGLALATTNPGQLVDWDGWVDVAGYLAVVLAVLSLVPRHC